MASVVATAIPLITVDHPNSVQASGKSPSVREASDEARRPHDLHRAPRSSGEMVDVAGNKWDVRRQRYLQERDVRQVRQIADDCRCDRVVRVLLMTEAQCDQGAGRPRSASTSTWVRRYANSGNRGAVRIGTVSEGFAAAQAPEKKIEKIAGCGSEGVDTVFGA